MASVTMTPDAQREFDQLPVVMRIRVQAVLERLSHWPAVSGAKPLRGELARSFRIRTGAYRVVFTPSQDGRTIIVWKIAHRGGVYE